MANQSKHEITPLDRLPYLCLGETVLSVMVYPILTHLCLLLLGLKKTH